MNLLLIMLFYLVIAQKVTGLLQLYKSNINEAKFNSALDQAPVLTNSEKSSRTGNCSTSCPKKDNRGKIFDARVTKQSMTKNSLDDELL